MKKNVGCVDRTIRMVAGIAIIAWGISSQNWLGAIGLIPLATGLLRWCPAYCPLGISTDSGNPSCCSGNSCKIKEQ
jgi:hypothetical protein